jgi:hypothetical protein
MQVRSEIRTSGRVELPEQPGEVRGRRSRNALLFQPRPVAGALRLLEHPAPQRLRLLRAVLINVAEEQ